MLDLFKEAIKETLKAIGVRLPRNFDALIEYGYKLVKELDELLKKDSEKLIINLKSKTGLTDYVRL